MISVSPKAIVDKHMTIQTVTETSLDLNVTREETRELKSMELAEKIETVKELRKVTGSVLQCTRMENNGEINASPKVIADNHLITQMVMERTIDLNATRVTRKRELESMGGVNIMRNAKVLREEPDGSACKCS